MGSEIVERLDVATSLHPMTASDYEWSELLAAAMDARARITALEAMCEKMAGYAEHDSDCVLSIPKAIRVRSSIQDKCSCGLEQTLAQYREADNGR